MTILGIGQVLMVVGIIDSAFSLLFFSTTETKDNESIGGASAGMFVLGLVTFTIGSLVILSQTI